MRSELKEKEIKECKEMIENYSLGYSQRENLKLYVKSLE